MAMINAEKLPQEIITEILIRMPAKFIGQYRCVSKNWLNILSEPQLIKAHLNIHAHKEEEEEKRIWVFGSHSLHTITFNPNHQNETVAISRKLSFQHLPDNWASVAGSCNGLVLMENKEEIQFLINPTTLKYHAIPNFHLALPSAHSCSMSGLGYDFATDDYKVVKLSLYHKTYDSGSTFVDVYSVRKDLWRRLECLPHGYEFDDLASGVLVNGALHWLALKVSNFSLVIFAFDLSGEKFLELPAPNTLDKDNMCFSKLVARKGYLCLFTAIGENITAFWMMKEYGVEQSWTKFSFIKLNSLFIPMCLTSEGDVILNVRGALMVYNMKEDQSSNMVVAVARGVVTFIESLVTPTF